MPSLGVCMYVCMFGWMDVSLFSYLFLLVCLLFVAGYVCMNTRYKGD